MKLISGTAHPALANQISEYLGQSLTKIEVKRFPDGEIFVKILENIRGHDVFIIQPTCQPGNDNLMELLIMMDACRRASAKRIICVLPYYGYARQDRKDQPRVPITAKLVANLLTTAGASRILAVDLHSQQIQGFFDIPVDHLYASPVIVGHLKSLKLDNIVVVSPDTGGTKMAYAYAQLLNADIAIVAKNRRSATEVDVISVVGEVEGCNAVLVDDMTTTAGTLCAASKVLKESGAKSVMAAVSHSLLNQEGIDRIRNSAISHLVTTDSVPARVDEGSLVTRLSLADLLGDAIMRIHNYQSVTSLFRIN
ncbi:MAG: ribose-phosphate pyrophosphokinase [Verrucomicrobia bacterium]|nr:ribose-phosphate pyrophosphokinase [Verrucomicrobiota bacterium]MCH8525694.1 ribose-phosphate pyrophosphokinase [Kiritimatiellia bacterium]